MGLHRDVAVRLVLLLWVVLAVSGCGLLDQIASDDETECPETLEEDGIVDGFDLGPPPWLPAGFPLPDGLSLRHINTNQVGTLNVFTGFIPDGDATAVIGDLERDLVGVGYEVIFSVDGFIPMGWEALAVADDDGVVAVDVTDEELPVRNDDGECPWQAGLLVGFKFDGPELRQYYDSASLTHGSARAVIAGREFVGDGECFVRPGAQHTFNAFDPISGAGISLDLGLSNGQAAAFASVEGADVVFALDVTPVSGVEAVFSLTDAGFSVEGMFVDAMGDLGVVPGIIEASCG